MKTNVKNTTSKKVVKKTAKQLVKKTAKKSESVILKTQVNNNWKKNTRSMSALVRYAKGEGANEKKKIIDATNKAKGTNVSLRQVANVKNVVKFATDRELYKNASTEKGEFIKGEKKTLFSFWLIILTVGRMAKNQ